MHDSYRYYYWIIRNSYVFILLAMPKKKKIEPIRTFKYGTIYIRDQAFDYVERVGGETIAEKLNEVINYINNHEEMPKV